VILYVLVMISPQQKQTHEYFSREAFGWRQKADGSSEEQPFNVIEARNNYALNVASSIPSIGPVLDVGCGTGELVCDLARKGIPAIGIDFSEEMILLCRQKAYDEKVEEAIFECVSFFDYTATQQFGLIVANGFIEYISPEELNKFLERSRRMLAKNGKLVVGSRNRLFNVFSLNDYTRMEIDAQCIDALLREALVIAQAKSVSEAIQILGDQDATISRSDHHPSTGIEVQTRYQYTPGELVHIFHKSGFAVEDLYPVHYHGVTPRLKDDYPELHASIANAIQENAAQYFYGIPYSSTFMVQARSAKYFTPLS